MTLSTADVAARMGVSADTVRAWIASEELRATNIAARADGRPEYRIDEDDLASFKRGRTRKKAAPPPRQRAVSRTARKVLDVIPFF